MHVGAEGAMRTADMAVMIIIRWSCVLVEERHGVASVERFDLLASAGYERRIELEGTGGQE